MIRFEDVTTECFKAFSFETSPGKAYKIITNSDHEKKVLLDTILGINKPSGGKVFIFDRDIWTMSREDTLALLERIGVVWLYGGLVSNLKIWENVSLPLWYHSKIGNPGEIEERVVELFNRLGRDVAATGYLGQQPGPLPLIEKRLIAVVRAILMEPDIVIYDSLFEGFDIDAVWRLVELTNDFHHGNRDRISIYLSSKEESLQMIDADVVVKQKEKRFVLWD